MVVIVGGFFGFGVLKVLSEYFGFFFVDCWFGLVFEGVLRGVCCFGVCVFCLCGWFLVGGVFFVFVVGVCVVCWVCVFWGGKYEVGCVSNVMKFVFGFSGVVFVVFGGVVVVFGLGGVFVFCVIVLWVFVVGGVCFGCCCVKECVVGFGCVCDCSVVVGVDVFVDVVVLVGWGFVDFVIVCLVVFIVVVFGVVFRVV